MREDRLETVKKEIRSVIITYPRGVTLDGFLRAYNQLIGARLPSREFGYTSPIDFLYTLTDVVRIQTEKNGEYQLNCIANEATEHIQKLVFKQRVVKPKSKNSQNRHVQTINCSVSKVKPFVSAPLRANLFQILNDYPDGINYYCLTLAYQKTFKRPLNLDWLSENPDERLEKLALAVAELEVKVVNDTKRLFYRPLVRNRKEEKHLNGIIQETPSLIKCNESQKNEEISNTTVVQKQPKNSIYDVSAIPRVVRDDFEKVLKLYPNGVLAKHFPFLYEKISGEIFNLADLGYNNFLELADALPDIFIYVKSFHNPNDWLLFHKSFSENAKHQKDINAALKISEEKQKSSAVRKYVIPSDIALPSLPFTQPLFPSDLDLSLYIPIFISAAISPGCFWFKLQTEEVIEKFRVLEDEMESFYHSCAADAYEIALSDLTIGASCVAQHDYRWYRVTITSSPVAGLVNAYLVDYGGWEKIQITDLRYLKSSHAVLPSQAFKAELAKVKPTNEAKTWSKMAIVRFLELSTTSHIMAKVHLRVDDVVSVFLCDTSGKFDVHINDTLVDEKLAKCYSDSNLSSPDEISEDSGTEEMLANEIKNPVEDQDIDTHSLKLTPTHTGHLKRTPPKCIRLVKRVCLGDGYKIHIILVSNLAYVPAQSLCNLFWRNKPAEILKARLEFKNVEIPTLNISKEENQLLFQQCENNAVPGFQETTLAQYFVVLYPLCYVMKVLNSLGHPSLKVRERIKKELENVVFSEEDCIGEMNDCDEKGDFESSSVYDLKALYEAVKCQRIKYQRNSDETSVNELRKIELLAEKIELRIQHIQSICSAYSRDEEQMIKLIT